MVTNCTLNAEVVSIKKERTSPIAKLGCILVNKKTISQTQLESALTIQFRHDKKLGELLVEQQFISREELEQALKEQYWRRNGYWVI